MLFSATDRKSEPIPWSGVGAAVLLFSLLVNLISIPLNVYHHEELVKLSPGINYDVPSVVSDIGIDRSLMSAHENTHEDRLLDILIEDKLALSDAGAPGSELSRHLASSSSSSSGSSSGCHSSGAGSGHGGGHHAHPHDTLIYLFISLMIGAAVMQISAKWPILQQTVLLFTIGFVCSLIIKGADLCKDPEHCQLGKVGQSYLMWMEIDPHLLLFTLLPALLAGDAMTIDTSVAKRVAGQCLWLAGPGVLIGGFGTAAFLMALLGWDFLLCLCTGSMLCATDPVAVVALLKELGASPIITVQIQGESLLNDGTAIVLYLISYNMIRGYEYDVTDIAEFLIKKAAMAFALGLFIGYFFFSWIRAASDKLDHSSGIIQITLTLCAAYWSFIFVEGVLGLSGVLATVSCSLVLAHHMWPYIVSPESMHTVWHTFESLGNMIVFFLAGSKTGDIFLDIDMIDIVNLLIIYIFLVVLRGGLIFASRPVLRLLSADKSPVPWEDAMLMTWGGLRGAVGLALALAVDNDLAPQVIFDENTGKYIDQKWTGDPYAYPGLGAPMIEAKQAQRVLFFVAGIAFLTTMVNATTAPKLVQKLGITAMPQARIALVKMFHEQLVGWSTSSGNPEEVTHALKHMLHEAYEHIAHQQVAKVGPVSKRISEGDLLVQQQEGGVAGATCQNNIDIVKQLKEQKKIYDEIPQDELHRGMLGGALPTNLLGKVDDMIELIESQWVDEGMAKVVNSVFLQLVYNNYWKLIEEGELRPGSAESEVLMTSVRVSLSPYRTDLIDFEFVYDKMVADAVFTDTEGDEGDDEFGALADADMAAVAKEGGCLGALVASWQFNVSVGVCIMLNSLQVCAEEALREPGSAIDSHPIWLILDSFFTVFFLFEFVAKVIPMKCTYFMNNWNRFDFFLVWVGVFGLCMSFATAGKEAEMAGKTRIIRVARVLRTLRFLRIFRLFHARMSADKFVSMELARHMKKVTTLYCFIHAHMTAQVDLVKYFGGNGKLDEANESEIARCILQSQTFTYRALIERAKTQAELGEKMFFDLTNLYKRKHITEGLGGWIMKAHADGALSATEAHAILHPLNHLIADTVATLASRAEGVMEGSDDAEAFAHQMSQTAVEEKGTLQSTMIEVKSEEGKSPTMAQAQASEGPAEASVPEPSPVPPKTSNSSASETAEVIGAASKGD